MDSQYFKTNQSLWDQKTPVHAASDFYNMDKFRQTKNSLNTIELEGLGDVNGKSLLHLQCHFGQDSLSWANLGASVTGVDFSNASIQLARQLSKSLEIPARFIQANVLELDQHLDNSFDIVFTSYGAICWLPDLNQWAKIISHFLKPGGIFYIADFHPFLWTFDHESNELAYHYFFHKTPYEEEIQGTYADPDAPLSHKEYCWSHSLAEVLTPLLAHDLELLEFKEFPFSPYNCFANMDHLPDGNFKYGDFKIDIPHVFSYKLQKKYNPDIHKD